MSEKEMVIDGLEMSYKGLFSIKDFFRKIDELLADRGYEKAEKQREELVKSSGKYLNIELRPTKEMAEFYTVMVKMRITITNLTDAEVLVDKIKRKMQLGDINIIFDAWTTTDYEKRWEQKAWYWLLRGFFERIFFRVHTNKYFSVVSDDTHYIYNNLKAHLNMYRYTAKEK